MNYVQFLETCKSRFHYQNKEKDLAHCSFGIMEESGELSGYYKKHIGYGHDLDKSEVIGEIGDFMWYLTMLTEIIGIPDHKDFKQISQEFNKRITIKHVPNPKHKPDGAQHVFRLYLSTASLMGLMEQNKWEESIQMIYNILIICNMLSQEVGVTLPEVLRRNDEKLEARHGKKFNPKATHEKNRNREKEKEALKGNDTTHKKTNK
jgi:NTP pyrophosphatase (non-canonical NTP hydrolase)